MESRNPAFGRSKEFSRQGYATFNSPPAYGSAPAQDMSPSEIQDRYAAPSATAAQTGRMTIDDVVVRTATVFGLLLATAAATYFVVKPQSFGLILVSMLIGLGLSLWISFSKTIRPPAILAYAAVEGVFVGGISYLFENVAGYQGIVPQAVLGTLGAFTAMLALYKTGVIRATPKFTKILLIAGAGYLVFGLVNLAISMFAGNSIYNSPLGFLVAGFGVVLASLFLVLDFDFVEQGIRNGLPREYAWTAAFGLTVTLVWLYIEILRLLAILRGDN